MNENLNLVEILKDCPIGTKLYSPVMGEVVFEGINDNEEEYPIIVKSSEGAFLEEEEISGSFTSDGKVFSYYKGGECALFPSKDQRDWGKFKVKKPKFDPKTLLPFDKVLARLDDQMPWYCELISFIEKDTNWIRCCGAYYKYCVPYNEETKYLVGTKEEAPEFYRYWEDAIDNNEIIKAFIDTNYKIKGSYIINGNIVDVEGKVRVKNHKIKSLTNGLFSFGVVDGSFYCSNCNSLKTLEGAPEKVGGSFSCSGCDSLKTLEGAPEKVDGNFYCDYCISLTTLKGAPREVGKGFKCTYCESLKTLEGAPEKVDRSFSCSNNNLLKTLKGAPKKVGGYFYCGYCNALTSLEGSPREVGENFYCDYCNSLTTLKGAPAKIGGDFYCSQCPSLTTLEGAPKNVKIIK